MVAPCLSQMTSYAEHLGSLGLQDLWGLSRVPNSVQAPKVVLWNRPLGRVFMGTEEGKGGIDAEAETKQLVDLLGSKKKDVTPKGKPPGFTRGPRRALLPQS